MQEPKNKDREYVTVIVAVVVGAIAFAIWALHGVGAVSFMSDAYVEPLFGLVVVPCTSYVVFWWVRGHVKQGNGLGGQAKAALNRSWSGLLDDQDDKVECTAPVDNIDAPKEPVSKEPASKEPNSSKADSSGIVVRDTLI